MATFCVTILGVKAQIRNSSFEPFLHTSVTECDCNVNTNSSSHHEMTAAINNPSIDEGFFSIFYRISYIYYSMIGTILTVFFGLIISYLTDNEMSIPKILVDDEKHEGGFRSSRRYSVGSFLSIATQHRLSSFIRNVSQSTLKVENKLKEVISHTNLHHLPHLHHVIVHSDDEERISILNEEDDQCEDDGSGNLNTGKRKMFYIGHHDEHDE